MKNRAFTLIEMMVVLVIIGILMGLILAGVFTAMESAKVSNAEANIATLEASISMYEVDVGSYPPLWQWNVCHHLTGEGIVKPIGWNGPYIHFKDEDTNAAGIFLDPWDQMYNYGIPGTQNPGFVDIYSLGPDKTSGTSDDITNW